MHEAPGFALRVRPRWLLYLVVALLPTGCVRVAPDLAADPRSDTIPTLADLNWMVGCWRGEGLGARVEEINLPPADSAMPAVFRTLGEARENFYEFLLYEAGPTGVTLRLHHFSPTLRRWEDEPVIFDLVAVAPGDAVFRERGDDSEHTELRYTRKGDTLRAELSEAIDNTRTIVATFEYELVSLLDDQAGRE